MSYTVDNNILHVIYDKKIPKFLIDIADMYEGKMNDRIGINFPFDIAEKWRKCCKEEVKEVKEFFMRCGKEVKYVIVYKKGDKDTKAHELMHAKYYIDDKYRESIAYMWKNMTDSCKKRVICMLKKMGYNTDDISIVIDEFQAYFYTEKSNFFGKII
jgi:hypothetical protein